MISSSAEPVIEVLNMYIQAPGQLRSCQLRVKLINQV